mgnify:CR=1 FL=1
MYLIQELYEGKNMGGYFFLHIMRTPMTESGSDQNSWIWINFSSRIVHELYGGVLVHVNLKVLTLIGLGGGMVKNTAAL